MEHAQQLGASERHACGLVNQPRGTQRYQPVPHANEDALTRAIVQLASEYGRYGYPTPTTKTHRWGPRIAELLRCYNVQAGR